MQAQYWVIGGEYDSIDFSRLVAGTCEVLGPFGNYQQATRAWCELAFATRYKALTRYLVVSNAHGESVEPQALNTIRSLAPQVS